MSYKGVRSVDFFLNRFHCLTTCNGDDFRRVFIDTFVLKAQDVSLREYKPTSMMLLRTTSVYFLQSLMYRDCFSR